jgi:AcrR family transcriptional regulator
MAVTPLERALDDDRRPAPSPIEALRVARDRWATGQGLDMGSLAAELGVSRATLYRWVGSKELLCGEVLWCYAAEVLDDARAAARGTGASYLVNVLEHYMRSVLELEPLRHFIEAEPEYALRVLASKDSPMRRRSIAALRDLLGEQVGAGVLEPAIEPDDLAYLIVRVVESFLFGDLITGSQPAIDRAVDAIDLLLHAPPRRRRRASHAAQQSAWFDRPPVAPRTRRG